MLNHAWDNVDSGCIDRNGCAGDFLARVAPLKQHLARRGINIGITGMDGAGKTTLAGRLDRFMRSADVPVGRLHIFRWYSNLLLTPWIILLNRYYLRRVLIYDRTIYDNLAKLFGSWGPRRLRPLLLRLIYTFYPAFDETFFLYAPFEQTRRSRPETVLEPFERLSSCYGAVLRGVHHNYLQLDSMSLSTVLDRLAAKAEVSQPWEH